MAVRAVAVLKGWFKRGMYPTQEQFGDLIDSMRHKNENVAISEVSGLAEQLNGKYAGADAKLLAATVTRLLERISDLEREVRTLSDPVAGDFAEFCEIVEGVQVEMASYTLEDFEVVWEAKALRFLAKVTERPVVGASESGAARIVGGGVVKYYANWPGADAYMNGIRSEPLRQRLFMCGGVLYYWTGKELARVKGAVPWEVVSKEQYESLPVLDDNGIYFITG